MEQVNILSLTQRAGKGDCRELKSRGGGLLRGKKDRDDRWKS